MKPAGPKPIPESNHDAKSAAQRRRWICLRGSARRRNNATGKATKRLSRLAKSISIVGVSQEAMDAAKPANKGDQAHVLIVCQYRDGQDGAFGIKLATDEAVSFFEAGLRLALGLRNGKETDE